MRTKFSVRRIRFPARRVIENPAEPAGFVLDDEEDAFCDPYLVASRGGDIPALQEYLHALQAE